MNSNTDSVTATIALQLKELQRFNLEREAASEAFRGNINSMASDLARVRTQNERFRLAGGAAVLLSFLSLVFAAWAVKEILGARAEIRAFQKGLFPQLNSLEAKVKAFGRNDKAQTSSDRDSHRDLNAGIVTKTDGRDEFEARSDVPHRVRGGSKYQGSSTQSQNLSSSINEDLAFELGIACLKFPLSIQQFRDEWQNRGGDNGVEMDGYPHEDDAAAIVVSHGSVWLAVPNTTNWDRLSKTGWFEPEGLVGPGTRVRELLEMARGQSARHGEKRISQRGRVRVVL